MIELGARERPQPAPPWAIWDALTEPRRPIQYNQWLVLQNDEIEPRVTRAERPSLVVWTSIWPDRPDDRIRFDISSDGGAGSRLRWTLESPNPVPADDALRRMRHRLNFLINGKLRESLG